MKRFMLIVLVVLILALAISPALGAPVEAKKGKTGPGYTSPPLCCTEEQCKGGPGWNMSPARVGPAAPGRVIVPGARK